MSDDPRPPRKPFGERDDSERQLPFGARPRRPDPEPAITPTTPYTRPAPPPPPEAEPESQPPAPPLPDLEPDAGYIFVDDAPPRDFVNIEEEVAAPPLAEPADEATQVGLDNATQELPAAQPGGWRRLLKGKPPPTSASMLEDEPISRDQAGGRVVIRFGDLLRAVGAMFGTAALIATLFTWWTPDAFLTRRSMESLAVALATQSAPQAITTLALPSATPVPALNNIGLVSGHKGLHPESGLPDPGAVCDDGVTEQAVNERVAGQTAAILRTYGYTVDILEEWDPRLNGYRALALVSIHADSCQYVADDATGYKIASFAESASPEEDQRLVECLSLQYGATTGLAFHPSVTYDMTLYHNFREIDPTTPGAIIEIGFLYLDKELLVDHSDVVALGVARGILCFLAGGPEPTPTVTPTGSIPTPTP